MNLCSHSEVDSAIQLSQAWIESQMAYRGIPGISVGVVYDQDLLWAKGFGCSDLESRSPATPATLYRIASISKTFTATALLQLRDCGKLQLDDPIEKHLSWFRIQNPFEDAPAVTIRQLLTHTAGLPREAAFPYWTDFHFPSQEEIRETLPRQDLSLIPDTRFKYSNLALALAGDIVEEVSGMPYADYVHQNILDPLEMTSSSVVLPPEHLSRLATGYGRRMPDGTRRKHPFTDSKGLTPAANLTSNIEDLAKFASAQFRQGLSGGRQILKGSTLREMHRVHWLEPDWSSGRGLGFGVWRLDRRALVGHGGHVAGYTTQLAFCPEEKIAVLIMTNADDGEAKTLAERIYSLVAPAILKALPAPARPASNVEEWKKYVGKYRSLWSDSQILILNGELVMVNPAQDNIQSAPVKLIPDSPGVFRVECSDGSQEIGEKVVFEEDEEGKVVRVKFGENYIYPVEAWS